MRFPVSLLVLVPLLGCAHGRTPFSTTADGLQLSSVVLYRNGVGYFERRGEVGGDSLRLRVRRDQVADLLKSLTVVDRRSGRAVSVSMPLDPAAWADAAVSAFAPGGKLADVLNGLRGQRVALDTTEGRLRGRIVMVEELVDEPDPTAYPPPTRFSPPDQHPRRDHKVTLLHGSRLEVIRLSKVVGISLQDGDLAMQLHRRLDASAGEGMFQQVEIEVRLQGGRSHDLAVSYVVPAPLWKPTYRVVLPEGGSGKALLQGWAVVDNVSGEDWNTVRLALTAGEPIAFAYDLHTPRQPGRPDLTETGVVRRAQVAVGETGVEMDAPQQAPAPEPAAPPAAVAPEESKAEASDDEAGAGAGFGRAAGPARRAAKSQDARQRGLEDMKEKDGGGDLGATGMPAAVDSDGLRRTMTASARAKAVAGLTRFDLRDAVTVPSGTSTMVAILNESVPAEETFLFRPGGAGTGYESNPYRVVRFKNDTPFVLESGPISIYAEGSFVGEGLSEAVGAGTSVTIPFSVEPEILVSSEVTYQGDEARLLRIVRGVLEVESFARQRTVWRVRGRARDKGYAVLVRHGKAGPGYRAVTSPEGTEDLGDAYLVPVRVGANAKEASAEVVEHTPSRYQISIWDGAALPLLEKLVLATDVSPDARTKLEPIVTIRREIGRIDTEVEGLRRQQTELDARAEQTRQNLQSIKKDKAAGSLRKRLTARLEEFTRDADRLGRRIVELESARMEQQIKLEDLVQDLDLGVAPATGPGAAGAVPMDAGGSSSAGAKPAPGRR